MVRGQHLGSWFGPLGSVNGSEEGDGGSRVFGGGAGSFFTSGSMQEDKRRAGATKSKMRLERRRWVSGRRNSRR